MGHSSDDTSIPNPTHSNNTNRIRSSPIHLSSNPLAHTPLHHIQTSHKETINTLSMKNNNKTNTPIPYTQTHTSRGQHPHQARVARNITDKTPNPPSAHTTPTDRHTEERNTPIPSIEEPITPIGETQPEPQSPTLVKRPRQVNNQPMMTSLPDYPAHGDSELPDHAQSHAQSPEP